MPLLEEFKDWMRRVGISWNEDLITFVDTAPNCSGFALGIFAATDVTEEDHLASIPKSACITIHTTAIADILEAEQLAGGLGLVIAVAYEMTAGADSKWHGYFKSVPTREYIPCFWNAKELKLSKGTEIEDVVEQQTEELMDDYNEHVVPLLEKYPDRLSSKKLTANSYIAAASLVSSRCFCIDDYHGDSMVPLADVFNHKVSVVEPAPGYELAQHNYGGDGGDSSSSGDSDSDSSDEDDEEDESESESNGDDEDHNGNHLHDCKDTDCQHDHHHHEEEEHADDENNKEEEHNGGGTTGVQSTEVHPQNGLTTANGLHLRLQIAILDNEEDDDNNESLTIIAASNIEKGNEIHNTYGEYGNATLLVKYGFALRQNPFTVVQLDKESLLDSLNEIAVGIHSSTSNDDGGGSGSSKKKKRKGSSGRNSKDSSSKEVVLEKRHELKELADEWCGVWDEEDEPFEVRANGYIDPALYAALRLLRPEQNLQTLPTSIEAALDLGREDDGIVIEPVQIWPGNVRDAETWELLPFPQQQKDDTTTTAANVENGDKQQHEKKEQPPITLGMCQALATTVMKRLEAYNDSYHSDIKLLHNLNNTNNNDNDSSSGNKALTDHDAAVRSALTLRITEQEMLIDCLIALYYRASSLALIENQADKSRISWLEQLSECLQKFSLVEGKGAVGAKSNNKNAKKRKA